jgi:hypothetical protein
MVDDCTLVALITESVVADTPATRQAARLILDLLSIDANGIALAERLRGMQPDDAVAQEIRRLAKGHGIPAE